MEFKNILIIAVVIIVLYLLYLWLFKDNTNYAIVQTTLKGNDDSQAGKKVDILPNGGTSLNYSYAFWIYINDYNYNYGSPKVILDRHESTEIATNHHTPLIYLGKNQNNLHVHITGETASSSDILGESSPKLEDIPLQKWCFIAVTLDNKVLDIYLDGKLVTSHYYDGIRKAPKNNDIIDINTSNAFDIKDKIAGGTSSVNTTKKGWGGILSNLEYFDRSLNAREIYERYRAGFTGAGGLLGGLGEDISKFNMKVSFLQDDVEVSQFKI
jgi:hypothetical protein